MPERIRLTVPSEERSLALVEAVTLRFAQGLEIPEDETASLAADTCDLVRFTLEHAYPQDPTGEVELTLDLVDRRVQIDVHDWGRPLSSAGGDLGALPDELHAIAVRGDDLRLVNLGADGKRLVYTTSVSAATDTGPDARHYDSPARDPYPGVDDLRDRMLIRDARPTDAEAIAQLLYENYHLTYGHPDFYRPEWVAEQLTSGTLLSTLAEVDDEVIGHHAVMPEPGKRSAETGAAVVHHAYRGLGVFNRIFDYTLERAEGCGLDAVWGRAVTVHPYSQRSEYSHGYRPTALMLGSVPAKTTMADVAGSEAGRRTASLLAFRALRPAEHAASLPRRYADLLLASYANAGLRPKTPGTAGRSGGAISVADDPSRATGLVTVTSWDPPAFAKALRHLLACHCDVIYADLALESSVATDEAVDTLREIGFFYAGLVLHGAGGHDFLRMQRMNAENVELDRIVCDSEFGKQLLAAVLEDRAAVEG